MMTDAPEPVPPKAPDPPEPPRYESSELFGDSRVVVIAHSGAEYRLFVTRNNRLILQK